MPQIDFPDVPNLPDFPELTKIQGDLLTVLVAAAVTGGLAATLISAGVPKPAAIRLSAAFMTAVGKARQKNVKRKGLLRRGRGIF